MGSYIKIIVPQPLDAAHMLSWFGTVQNTLPSGMIGHTDMVTNHATKSTRYFCHRTRNGKMCYVIPLVRDMDVSEAHDVVRAWCQAYREGDFLIDYSQTPGLLKPQPLEANKMAAVMEAWCKLQHKRWMESLLEQGWSYGVAINSKQKTHPWLQPWEQLPSQAQRKHTQSVRDLLEILKQSGYNLVQMPLA
jgi:RyR domain